MNHKDRNQAATRRVPRSTIKRLLPYLLLAAIGSSLGIIFMLRSQLMHDQGFSSPKETHSAPQQPAWQAGLDESAVSRDQAMPTSSPPADDLLANLHGYRQALPRGIAPRREALANEQRLASGISAGRAQSEIALKEVLAGTGERVEKTSAYSPSSAPPAQRPRPAAPMAEATREADQPAMLSDEVASVASNAEPELSQAPELLMLQGAEAPMVAASVDPGIPESAFASSATPQSIAQRYLRQLENLDDLVFQQAEGYWSNRYLPGDPLMRVLSARLARLGNADSLEAISTAARQNWQPFDAPQNAALALYLAADKAAVEQSSRLRLQIGLQGTSRLGGQRPAMNLAIVLDPRGMQHTAHASAARALLLELARTRQVGDHFSLVISGRPDIALAAQKFRFGALQLALEELPDSSSDTQEDLPNAIRHAAAQLRSSDDPSAPLGSSTVLLLSAGQFSPPNLELESIAHENALDGIGLSVVTIGQDSDPSAIEPLVLAGQGQRWILHRAGDASRLAEQLLFAASRAVARAVRLRIALAPGVKLIEVLGADKLEEPAAQRVREAEQQIDLRIARNLGIRADRGEDEQGIQIVIPHYYADSSHVVLLDLLVPGPGALAEVSVRYKDLVYGRNGVAQAQLSLPAGENHPGPLQHNVMKNRLAYELAERLRQSGEYLANHQTWQAGQLLVDTRALLAGMQQSLPAWQEDQELLSDQQLLGSILEALQQQPHYLPSALQLAAYRRLTETYSD